MKAPHIALLALAAAAGPLAMNVYLPALGSITEYFQTSPGKAQLSVSLFLAATAIFQLIAGPLSDRFGRRPVMLSLLTVTLLGTLVCIFAPTIEVFLAGRIIQASSAVGMVLSRTIVRDLTSGDDSASMIGYVTMGMTVVPMTSPAIGGILASLFGWQAGFWLIFGYTAIVILSCWYFMGETNREIGGSMRQTFQSWPELFRSKRFWGYASSCTLASAAFFAFLGAAPIIAVEYYDLDPAILGFYFFFVAAGYMAGNFLAGKFAKTVGLNRMIILGNLVGSAGLVAGLYTSSVFQTSALACF